MHTHISSVFSELLDRYHLRIHNAYYNNCCYCYPCQYIIIYQLLLCHLLQLVCQFFHHLHYQQVQVLFTTWHYAKEDLFIIGFAVASDPVWVYIVSVVVALLISGLILIFGITLCCRINKQTTTTCPCVSDKVSISNMYEMSEMIIFVLHCFIVFYM